MSNVIDNHLTVTTRLFNLLKEYIECKNYGIHGFFIKTAHKVLNELMVEVFYLRCIEKYLNNQPYELRGQMKEVPVYLQYKVAPDETVKKIRDEAYSVYL